MPVRCTPALRHILLALSLAALPLALPKLLPPAAAAETVGDLFMVRDVAVDVTAASATAARDQGIQEGQRRAWAMLVDRLTPAGTTAPTLPAEELGRMVEAFQVQEERTSAVRYLGRLAVRFNPTAVRTALRNRGVAFTEIRSKPLVLLPVDQTSGQPVLWQEETGWRTAWGEVDAAGGLVPLLLPMGDAQDVSALDAATALAGDPAQMQALAEKYRAGGVVVTVLGPQNVSSTIHRDGGSPETFTSPVPAGRENALEAAALTVMGAIDDAWAKANIVQGGAVRTLAVTVPLADMGEWVEVRKRLSQVPTVTGSRVISLSRGKADLELTYQGDESLLRTALAQQDLGLSTGGGTPTLRYEGRRPTSAGTAPAAETGTAEPSATPAQAPVTGR